MKKNDKACIKRCIESDIAYFKYRRFKEYYEIFKIEVVSSTLTSIFVTIAGFFIGGNVLLGLGDFEYNDRSYGFYGLKQKLSTDNNYYLVFVITLVLAFFAHSFVGRLREKKKLDLLRKLIDDKKYQAKTKEQQLKDIEALLSAMAKER